MRRQVSWKPQQVREARTQPLGVLPLMWWALQSQLHFQALLEQRIPILTPKIDEYLNQELEYVRELLNDKTFLMKFSKAYFQRCIPLKSLQSYITYNMDTQ